MAATFDNVFRIEAVINLASGSAMDEFVKEKRALFFDDDVQHPLHEWQQQMKQSTKSGENNLICLKAWNWFEIIRSSVFYT